MFPACGSQRSFLNRQFFLTPNCNRHAAKMLAPPRQDTMAVKDGWRLGEVTLPNAHCLEVAEVVMRQIRCVPTVAQAMAQAAVSRQVSSCALELHNFAKVL